MNLLLEHTIDFTYQKMLIKYEKTVKFCRCTATIYHCTEPKEFINESDLKMVAVHLWKDLKVGTVSYLNF